MAETPFWLWKPHFSRFEMSSGPNPVGFSLFPQDFTKQSPIPSACWCVVSEEKKRSGLVLLDFRKGEKIVAGKFFNISLPLFLTFSSLRDQHHSNFVHNQ